MLVDKPQVCVLTARGMAAISSIALSGAEARGILERVFRSNHPLPSTPSSLRDTPPSQGESGLILHGSIVDGDRVIDEVVVGYEGADTFVIHCHGNPLLAEQIVKLLQSLGAELTDAKSFALKQHKATSHNMIEAEAKLAIQQSATLLGAKILQAQIDGGLSKWAGKVLETIDSMDAEDIKPQSSEIIERSKIAQRIIEGVRIVIAGPPNSGKSTLLNCLAGQQQAIVSDTAGTTRDWVSVTCQLGPIRAEFVDTAGLDETLVGQDAVEQHAQQMTRQLVESCDMVLYVQDIEEIRSRKPEAKIDVGRPVVFINNKCDLVQEFKDTKTQEPKAVYISAKDNDGIGSLIQTILCTLGVDDFDSIRPVAFTERQIKLLSGFIQSNLAVKAVFSELLFSEN